MKYPSRSSSKLLLCHLQPLLQSWEGYWWFLWELWVLFCLIFRSWEGGGCLYFVQSRKLGACASPSEVYLAGKLQWRFTCVFDFRHSLWMPLLQSLRAKEAILGCEKSSSSESPLKMMKSAFDFTLDAHFIRKMFKILFWLFAPVGNRLPKKLSFTTPQTCKQIIILHILLNI